MVIKLHEVLRKIYETLREVIAPTLASESTFSTLVETGTVVPLIEVDFSVIYSELEVGVRVHMLPSDVSETILELFRALSKHDYEMWVDVDSAGARKPFTRLSRDDYRLFATLVEKIEDKVRKIAPRYAVWMNGYADIYVLTGTDTLRIFWVIVRGTTSGE